MPISEARLAANRANALQSTGPRTEEGKARSRENALKHGLTGDGVVLSSEDAEALIHHIAIEPRTNHRRLMATPEWVDLLIDAWEQMRIDLHHRHGTRWTYRHSERAEYFHGLDVGTIAPDGILRLDQGAARQLR